MTNEDKNKKSKIKKDFRRRRKEFAREERASIARQKKERKESRKKYRRKISILKSIQDYFKEVNKRKAEKLKNKKETDVIRKKINQGIRKSRIKKFKNSPKAMGNSFNAMRKRQRNRFQRIYNDLQRTTSGFVIIKESPGLRTEFLKSFFNSLATFLLAFITLYLVCNIASVIAAKYYDIPAILYSYRIFWPLYTYSSLYSRQALIIIFAAGPLTSIFFSILLFQLLKRILYVRINLKIFLLWLIFHALNLFFGAYIIGVITRTGFIYTTEWLFYSHIFDVEEILFMIISIATLLIFGFYFTRYFLLSANNNLIISPKVRVFYLLARVLFPWVLGIGILYALNYPNNPPELMLLLAVSFLMIIPMFFNYNSIQNKGVKLKSKDEEEKEFVGWIYILLALLLLGFYRFVFFNGVSFG